MNPHPRARGWPLAFCLATALVLILPAAQAAPGDLDPAFGAAGKVLTDFGGSDTANGVAVQSDGKIVTAGETFDPTSLADDFALARYNVNGSLDSGFGSGGKVRTDFGGSDFGTAVAVQADGKIVVAGGGFLTGVSTSTDFALARYNPDGSLDSTFGGSGKVVTDIHRGDVALGLAIQGDGKIVAVGTTNTAATGIDYDFALVRYNPNGSLDSSFGGVGWVITPFTTFASSRDIADSVVVQPDGKIVAAGVANASTPSVQDFALARYNPDGSLDGSFDGDGKVDTPDPAAAGAESIAIQPDGKLVVAGNLIARYDSSGSLDPSFGSNGKVAPTNYAGRIVLVQPDRKIVVAGAATAGGADFLVARLKPDGSEDASFGGGGPVRTDLGSNTDDTATAAVLQADRRIVVAGVTGPSGSNQTDFGLVRYLNPAPVVITCRVPSVRGKKLRAAKSAITKAHCRVGKVTRKQSRKVKRGRVISQSPRAGKTLPNLGKVNLVVSRGRKH